MEKSVNNPSPLSTPRARIRLPEEHDAPAILHYRIQNKTHFAPWEPLREPTYYTMDHCIESIGVAREHARLDRGHALLVFDPHERALLATINFANVVRGAFQACHLGYGIARHMQGQGLMQETLRAAIDWAFCELHLHRVMANYVPRNERSAKLLANLGFEREGYARRYLRIAGEWEDHILTALVHPVH